MKIFQGIIICLIGMAIPWLAVAQNFSTPQPTDRSGGAISAQTAMTAVNTLQVKNSPGNFYGLEAVSTASGWLIVFDSVASPSNGSIANCPGGTGNVGLTCAVDVCPLSSVNSVYFCAMDLRPFPERFYNGIWATCSSSPPPNLTLQSTCSFLAGDAQ